LLRKILVASQSFGDAEKADFKSKLAMCRESEFRNYGVVAFFEAIDVVVDPLFAPTKFCYHSFECLDDALGFKEIVSCTLCDSHVKEDDVHEPGSKCPVCSHGTLG
jgi:hypothetical protein